MKPIIDIDRSVAEKFMDRPEMVTISETNRMGWMTYLRTDRNITHDGVRVLQIRHSDDGTPCTIEDGVLVNHYGDILVSDETYDELLKISHNDKQSVYYYLDRLIS